jgi:hypothetical protein
LHEHHTHQHHAHELTGTEFGVRTEQRHRVGAIAAPGGTGSPTRPSAEPAPVQGASRPLTTRASKAQVISGFEQLKRQAIGAAMLQEVRAKADGAVNSWGSAPQRA